MKGNHPETTLWTWNQNGHISALPGCALSLKAHPWGQQPSVLTTWRSAAWLTPARLGNLLVIMKTMGLRSSSFLFLISIKSRCHSTSLYTSNSINCLSDKKIENLYCSNFLQNVFYPFADFFHLVAFDLWVALFLSSTHTQLAKKSETSAFHGPVGTACVQFHASAGSAQLHSSCFFTWTIFLSDMPATKRFCLSSSGLNLTQYGTFLLVKREMHWPVE